jgi:hypothetical protein
VRGRATPIDRGRLLRRDPEVEERYMIGGCRKRVLMAETAIQFLERWRQAHVYAELRALVHDKTVRGTQLTGRA